MWCSNCHQDVPGVAQAASGRTVCARCQRPISGPTQGATSPICDEGIALDDAPITARRTAPPIPDDWSARQHARALDRKLRSTASAGSSISAPAANVSRRFDPPQNLFDQSQHFDPPTLTTSVTPASIGRNRPRRARGSQLVAWFVVLSGVAISGAGLGLIYRSVVMGQMHFWNLGLGLAIGGQGTLIFGLAMVVMHLWSSSRQTVGKLQEVHARLAELQHTAEALTAMRSGGSPAFYAELVRGASPQMLLTNLKGQLDQLATRLSGIR
jgi:hypothetical protein